MRKFSIIIVILGLCIMGFLGARSARTATSNPPVGSLDGVDSNGQITGWAIDPDDVSQVVAVRLYIDIQPGAGDPAVSTLASVSRSDVGPHGFSIVVPASFWDGSQHSIYAYVVDLTDPSGSSDDILAGSPATFTLAAAQSLPIITAFTVDPAALAPGQSAVLSWSVTGANTLSIDNSVGVVTGSSVTITPSQTATYTLVASNSSGSSSAQVVVTVTAASSSGGGSSAESSGSSGSSSGGSSSSSGGGGGGGGGGSSSSSSSSSGSAASSGSGGASSTTGSSSSLTAVSSRLVKYADSPTVYLLANNTKQPISSWAMFQSSYRGVPIATIPTAQTYANGETLHFGSGTLLKTLADSAVYLVLDNGSKYGFKSAEEFARFGYRFDLVEQVSQSELDRYPLATIAQLAYHAQGQFIKYPDNPTVYRMEAGLKRPITSWALYQTYADPKYILTVQRSDFVYPDGALLAFPDGSLIKGASSPTVYFVESGKKRGIRTAAALTALGYTFSQIVTVPDSDLSLNPTGQEME